jgi:hypothetical protein
MTGLFRGIRTDDGRLISREAAYSYADSPVIGGAFFEVESGPDLVAGDSRFPPPMPKEVP